MKIIIESPVKIPHISAAFAMLTTGGIICLDDIRYNSAEGIVEIRMKRKELLVKPRKTFLGRPIYHSQTWIDSVLTIRQVVAMKRQVDDTLVTECNSCFTVKMGMKIDEDEIYLGSLEEERGKTLCEIFIKVKGFNIEFFDSV
jgi:hypothetical protein